MQTLVSNEYFALLTGCSGNGYCIRWPKTMRYRTAHNTNGDLKVKAQYTHYELIFIQFREMVLSDIVEKEKSAEKDICHLISEWRKELRASGYFDRSKVKK